MRIALQRFLFVGLVLALTATACRADEPDLAAAEAPLAATATPASPAPTDIPVQADPTPSGDPAGPAAAPTTSLSPAFSEAPPAGFVPPETWNEPLVVDPAVIEGVLDNGMTYLIRRNDRPGLQAQLRLVVRTGSVNESPEDLGVAHFLEHMMFNGTEQFPGNEIVQVLEGFGSGFGPDVNAYTSFEETVYELQVPARSTDSLQLGLDVLYEWATAASIEPDDVVAERGVVREEYRRAVEPVSGRIGEQVRDVLLEDSNYQGQSPLGSLDVIDNMTAEQLRDFYETWYRPDLMTVVAVGDFDVGDIERRIRETFVQPVPTEPVPVSRANEELGPRTEATFEVITDVELQRTEVDVYWRLADPGLQTQASVRSAFVRSVALSMLNTRLFELVQGGESTMLSARSGVGGFTPSTQIVTLSAQTPPDQVDAGLAELLTQIEQARQFGFSQTELDRALGEISSAIDQEFASRDTRQDRDYATDLVSYTMQRTVPTNPDETLEVGREILESITVEDARRFLFDVLEVEPFVVVSGPAADTAELPTSDAIALVYHGIVGIEVDALSRLESDQTELMERPEPAQVIDRERLDALDATVVTYENGVRLAFRPTTITENVVLLEGYSHGGAFAVEGPAAPLIGRADSLVGGSGFESVDIVTLDRLLAGSIASAGTSIGRAEETVSGDAATDDLETLLQLVHLQMSEPTISALQVRQFDERWRPLAKNPSASPAVAADLELWSLRYGDSPWYRLIPTVQDLDALDEQLLLETYRERFGNAGDFVFVVVGDFDESELVDLGARYLGTLPDSGVRETAIERDPGLPEENLQQTVRAGVGDQGQVRINWESPYPFTLEASVTAEALELVVNARLRDLIREDLGASYAPRASISVLSEPVPWVDSVIDVESDPDRVEEVSRTIFEELDRIRVGDIDQRYVDLAITQLSEGYRFSSNQDWADLVIFHLLYPDRAPAEFSQRTAIAERLTVTDMAQAAQIVFPASRSVEVRLVPADAD